MYRYYVDTNSKFGSWGCRYLSRDFFARLLDRFRERLSSRRRRRADRVLKDWKLWDHMDAILSLGVTSLVDRLLGIVEESSKVATWLRILCS